MSLPPQWFHDPSDVFPGDFYCYVLMSKDKNDVVTVHDIVRRKEPVSDDYLRYRLEYYVHTQLARASIGRSSKLQNFLDNPHN